jgi:mono/diheme cytochrome c family protein
MKVSFPSLGVFVLVPFLCALGMCNSSRAKSQEKPAEPTATAKSTKTDAEGKNPIKETPENLAEAKKLFGYDCAMCHGATADGKGDLAASMGMKVNDWRDSSRLEAMSDHEIFEIIMKGKGRMVGEADRYSADTVWELVNYVRTFARKENAAVPKVASAQ